MWKKKAFNENTNQAIFSLHIDFSYHSREQYGELTSGRRYHLSLKREDRQSFDTYSSIVDYVTNIIDHELKNQYQGLVGLSIKQVKVVKTYSGSINVLFSVIFNTLGVISGLKDLYDCIDLIKEISDAHIKNRMQSKYGDIFDISTKIVTPKKDCIQCGLYKESGNPISVLGGKRDAFFYYLLISNIVLLLIIGVLVYRAVFAMYW